MARLQGPVTENLWEPPTVCSPIKTPSGFFGVLGPKKHALVISQSNVGMSSNKGAPYAFAFVPCAFNREFTVNVFIINGYNYACRAPVTAELYEHVSTS